ncbi:MAG TPA: error-prone DNA polymerase [Burkholderiaceae bacterium]|nr:error-prone DNA polymerase [Burkholderiaceae bacterium]
MEPPALTPEYAELHCLTNFSFQRGASHAEELVARAHALGYTALAITDECSVAGVVRAHVEAKKRGLKLLPGAEFAVDLVQHGQRFTAIALPQHLQGWGNLCEFITHARRAAPKGRYLVSWADSPWALLAGCEILLALPSAINIEAAYAISTKARGLFGTHLWLAVELQLALDDDVQLHHLQQIAALTGVPLVAAGNVHMHVRSRKPLQDVITAVRLGKSVDECGFELLVNAEAHLRSRERLAAIYPPELLANTQAVAARCTFNLDELRYQYPAETVLPSMSPAQTLRHFTFEGALIRYPDGIHEKVQQQVEHELALITELKYEMYFLTVHDIVHFARSVGILCQGRGSAANSAVCYCLGITEVNPLDGNLLFARFISRERNEPPDIDVDFEHDRREEVIQYIYEKYGRDRAAIAATVVTYRPRSAIRDVGKALGVADDLIDRFAKEHFWFDGSVIHEDALAEWLSVRPEHVEGVSPTGSYTTSGYSLNHIHQWLVLTQQLLGFPRHLSQHVGGFVLTQGKLTQLVPVENAAMVDRSIIQWDKDDLDAMGLLKVDVLALGMLSAIRRCLDLVGQCGGPKRMQDIPREDKATYDMICAADTAGVFQIESRAQMSMLPRLKPRCFYDLVVEVAIVRPGPIQGGMVHPYLKARQNPGNVKHPSKALEEALGRTLGIPIFQEQVMQIAILAADFSPGEADELRRSMAAWKRSGGVHKFHDRLVHQMVKNGYEAEFAESIFKQILGFGEYGFPESHAASFAQLAYVSSWLKCHYPACFLTALLNSQPMGFYPPAQLVYDAKRHGVEVRAVDVMVSEWDCTLDGEAVRLGLNLISGLSQPAAARIAAARTGAPFTSTEDLALRAMLNADELKALAAADALTALSGHRRQQVWDSAALKPAPPLLESVPIDEVPLLLNAASEGEEVVFDYASVGLTLRRHPLQILREQLSKMKLLTAAQLRDLPHGRLVRACGIVTARQQPPTAKGVVFITLEDETGTVNVIVWKRQREKQREEVLKSRLLAVYGVWQRNTEDGAKPAEKHQGEVRHLIAHHLIDLTHLLGALATQSREFH